MALSILKGIEKMLSQEEKDSLGIKWPNDIVLAKKKICGILTELFPTGNENEFFVVIGVGINVNQPAELFPEEIRDMAGSVFSITDRKISRSELIAQCMKRFESFYEAYVRDGNLSALKKEYEDKLLNRGQTVRVLDPKGEYEAFSRGITDDGALVVELSDGEVREINAGEVSVRGLYGYT
jgi:BirA family biotin operon repressor/biotin-[acetyl-CoA-carboxylase] ligase